MPGRFVWKDVSGKSLVWGYPEDMISILNEFIVGTIGDCGGSGSGRSSRGICPSCRGRAKLHIDFSSSRTLMIQQYTLENFGDGVIAFK